ncbi:MAG: sodium:alanine symporter family protein [Rikenellaceae bacterium]
MNTSKLNDLLSFLDSHIGGSQWFVIALLATGLFFTIYLKFPQIRYFKHALKVLSGKYDDKNDEGDSTHFQSLATALSGTIGTGNIAGVALAIHLGGPSALFWMFMTAVLGMTTKMVEVTLSHKYRVKADDGTMSGGPMYYMSRRLNMKWLGVLFAFATIICSFGTGSLPQINSISNSMFQAFGVQHWISGAVLAILLGIIIIGGVKRIVKVSAKLIPFMTIIFFVASILVLVYNYENIIPSIKSIFANIFTDSAPVGGFLGAGFAWVLNKGVNRGLFSNEAGQGSAPIAHAAAKTKEPVSEGMVALLEPFIDTVVVCMLTGLVILSSGVWNEKFENKFQFTDVVVLDGTYDETNENDVKSVSTFLFAGNNLDKFTGELSVKDGEIQNKDITILHAKSFAENVIVKQPLSNDAFNGTITIENGLIKNGSEIDMFGNSLVHSAPLSTLAFRRSFFGDYGGYVIPIALLLFAFSTAIAWFYYASRAIIYLWGTKWIRIFQIIYVIAFFIASFADTSIIWTLSGIGAAVMTLPNLFAILLLRKEVKSSVNEYSKKYKI